MAHLAGKAQAQHGPAQHGVTTCIRLDDVMQDVIRMVMPAVQDATGDCECVSA